MRSAVVASSILALSLFCQHVKAGFPYGGYPQDAPSYDTPQFRMANVPNRLSSAVRSAIPKSCASAPQYGGGQYLGPSPRGIQMPSLRGDAALRPQFERGQNFGRGQYNVAQFDGYGPQYGTPYPTNSPVDSMTAPPVGTGSVQGGAILEAPDHAGQSHSGHVHGPGCATGNCPGEIVHSDVLLNSVPDPMPAYQSAQGYQEPVYQTQETGYYGGNGDCGGGYGYDAAPYYESMTAASWDYGQVATDNGCPTWFGGVYGLIMTRDGDEDIYFLANSGDPSALYLRSDEFETGFSGGIEARVGRTFNCCRWGMEFVYWGLFPGNEFAQFDGSGLPNVMVSIPDYANVFDALNNPLTNYTDALVYARARRTEEYHNIEINLLSGPLTLSSGGGGCQDACGSAYSAVVGYGGGYGGGTYGGAGYPVYDGCGSGGNRGRCNSGGCGATGYQYGQGDGYGPGFYGQGYGNVGCTEPRWIANWVFGARFFKFNERVMLDYSSVGPQINGVTGEVSHDYDAENNLVGVQLGVDLNYCLSKRLHFDFGSKFGMYGNHASSRQQIYTPDGLAYVLPTNPQDFDVNASEDNVAFLGELRAGLGLKVGRHLRFTGGYRAIAVSGVATALGQQVDGRVFGALNKVADIDSDDSIVLHGAYVGSEFAW